MEFFDFLFSPTPETIGKKGEDKLENTIKWITLFNENAFVFRNLYVPNSKGGTSEIDLLLLTKKGLFVVESKNYIGYIFGDCEKSQWTQTVYKGKSFWEGKKVDKHHFYNPVWQNQTHMNNLKSTWVDLFQCSLS